MQIIKKTKKQKKHAYCTRNCFLFYRAAGDAVFVIIIRVIQVFRFIQTTNRYYPDTLQMRSYFKIYTYNLRFFPNREEQSAALLERTVDSTGRRIKKRGGGAIRKGARKGGKLAKRSDKVAQVVEVCVRSDTRYNLSLSKVLDSLDQDEVITLKALRTYSFRAGVRSYSEAGDKIQSNPLAKSQLLRLPTFPPSRFSLYYTIVVVFHSPLSFLMMSTCLFPVIPSVVPFLLRDFHARLIRIRYNSSARKMTLSRAKLADKTQRTKYVLG